MCRVIFTLSLLPVLLLAGCIPTLQPLYEPRQVVQEPALVGVWKEPGGDTSWEFRKGKAGAYQLCLTDKKGETSKFEAHVCRIKGKTFLDLKPIKDDLPGSDFYKLYLLPAHTFFYVPEIGPVLKLSFMEPRWLRKHLKEQPDAIPHTKMDDLTVLTATTAQLQAFVLEHLETEGAFTEPSILQRAGAQP